MSISIAGYGRTLTKTRTALFTAPSDCTSATVVAGTVTNTNSALPTAKLFISIGGRNLAVVVGGNIPFVGGPWEMVVVTLKPGESLDCWTDDTGDGSLDMAVTVGVQK